MPERGRFLTFEGGEGAGKSTQIARLAASLRQKGLSILTTREPGGSPGAESIRTLLVTGTTGRWDAISEALLNFAARRDHLVTTIWPALQRGEWVLCDRFADSTVAYQGYGGKMSISAIRRLYTVAVGDFAPDITLVLDVPVLVGLGRAIERGGGEDRYEQMDRDFHERLRMGFLAIARREPKRCVVIDGTASADDVQVAILDAVLSRLGTGTA